MAEHPLYISFNTGHQISTRPADLEHCRLLQKAAQSSITRLQTGVWGLTAHQLSLCAVQAVEASVGWASWALDQGLITASELHPAPPSSTKPTAAQGTSTEAHTTAAGEPTGLLLLQDCQEVTELLTLQQQLPAVTQSTSVLMKWNTS